MNDLIELRKILCQLNSDQLLAVADYAEALLREQDASTSDLPGNGRTPSADAGAPG